jgi:hypothetical protein
MKPYIKNLFFGGVALLATGCTDLETDIVSFYPTFPDNDIAISGEFEGCYFYNRNEAWFGRNFWEGVFLAGDEAVGICLNGVYDDSGRYRDPSIHNFRPDLPGVGLMGDMLSGITYTNTRILNYGGQDGKDPIVAPLRAIRAYYHFWNMELYGDVPILDHPLAEDEVSERQPRAEVAKWIESELLEVIPQLDEANDASTYGRPNKWMAEALLVKLYLNWGVYTHDITTVDNNTPNEKLADCVKWCDELINCGVFEVGTGYRKKFFPDNGVQIKDFIYAVPMDPATLGAAYYGGAEFNRWWDFRKYTYCDYCTWSWVPSQSTAGIYLLTPEAVDRFNLEGDERNDMIAVGQAYVYDVNYNLTDQAITAYNDARHRREYGPLVYAKDFEWANINNLDVGSEDDMANVMKGARLFKYPPRQEDDLLWSRKQANDIPVFRLADILLTKAECILRGATATNGDTPASLMNKVRDCASAPHVSGTPTLQDILDERSREFIMEPWRRNDLIRFGKFENCADWKVKASASTMADVNKRLMPIPTGEMNTNTNWDQNPGY